MTLIFVCFADLYANKVALIIVIREILNGYTMHLFGQKDDIIKDNENMNGITKTGITSILNEFKNRLCSQTAVRE